MAAYSRHFPETFSGRREMLTESTHRLRSVHSNVVEPGIGSEHSGESESAGEWPASQVHHDWPCIGKAAGEDTAKSLGKFLEVPQLVVVGVEKDPVIDGQIAPWFIEVCLTAAHDIARHGSGVESESRSRDGARVVPHAISDLGAPKARHPFRQFGGHSTIAFSVKVIRDC